MAFFQSPKEANIFKSYSFVARDATSGVHFNAGFYDAPEAAAQLTQDLPTVTHGGVNAPYAAHAFAVVAGPGEGPGEEGDPVILTISGTSITDAGVRAAGDSEVLVADGIGVQSNQYFETTKKWIGRITYTLSSGDEALFSLDFNYGFAKYETFSKQQFVVVDFECLGLANANDASFDVELLHHKQTGWTYSLTVFVPGSGVIVGMNATYSTEQDIDAGKQFAFKRSGLTTAVEGDAREGILIRMTTGANNSVSYMDTHVGVNLD